MSSDISQEFISFPEGVDNSVGTQYKSNIGKLLPLSYPITEVENWLEQNETGDFIVLVTRDYSPIIKEEGERGLNVIHIRTLKSREFFVFYNQKYKQFGLFFRKQTGKDTFEYWLLASWGVTIEECEWFDPSVMADPKDAELIRE